MFGLYKDSVEDPTKFIAYRRSFTCEFNSHCHQPKRDFCDSFEAVIVKIHHSLDEIFHSFHEEYMMRRGQGKAKRDRDKEVCHKKMKKM
jgi:hypothetical protein